MKLQIELRKIGNSQGFLISKKILDEFDIGDVLELDTNNLRLIKTDEESHSHKISHQDNLPVDSSDANTVFEKIQDDNLNLSTLKNKKRGIKS